VCHNYTTNGMNLNGIIQSHGLYGRRCRREKRKNMPRMSKGSKECSAEGITKRQCARRKEVMLSVEKWWRERGEECG